MLNGEKMKHFSILNIKKPWKIITCLIEKNWKNPSDLNAVYFLAFRVHLDPNPAHACPNPL